MPSKDSPRRGSRRPRPKHGESSRRNHQKKRRSHTRRPGTSSDDTGETRGSHSLSSGALAQLEKENAKRKKHAERDRRRASHRREEPRRNADAEREHLRSRKHKHKKKRVVSGAIMEEGRAKGHNRGWSEDSYEKEELLPRPKKRWNKKRLREFCLSLLMQFGADLASSSPFRCKSCARHHYSGCCCGG